MSKKGIDVSKWQAAIDWAKVAADGVKYAILRAGYGKLATQKDTYFEKNYSGVKAAGIPVGAYWYSYAMTVAEAKEEAAACLACIKGKSFEYPVYFDVEESSQAKLGKSLLTDIVIAFCEAIKAAGYTPGVYANKSFLTNSLDTSRLAAYSIWLAHYTSKTDYTGKYDIWQYSSTGSVAGITGNVDMNYCYTDQFGTVSAGSGGSTSSGSGSGTGNTSQTTHTVASGDTLSAIAKKYGTTVNAIVAANKGKYSKLTADYIQVGWVLTIPGASGSTSSGTKTLTAGTKITLSNAALYASATSTIKAGTKSGTFYIWSSEVKNGRIRITNSAANVGNASQVTGWVAVSDCK